MSAAFGVTTTWTAGNDDWFICTNWDNGCPDSTTDAQINNAGTAQINDQTLTAQAHRLTLGLNAGDSGAVSVSAPHGDLIVGEAIFVGNGALCPAHCNVHALASELPDDSLHSFLRTPRHGVLFIEAMNPFTPLPRHPLGVFSFESIRDVHNVYLYLEPAPCCN